MQLRTNTQSVDVCRRREVAGEGQEKNPVQSEPGFFSGHECY